MILDTSVIVAAERGTLQLAGLVSGLGHEPVGVAAITASELLHGCLRAGDASRRARSAAFVDALLETIPVYPFGMREARRHAALWAYLAQAGTPIGPYDMLIGATALARGERLATLNHREFRWVPGLSLADIEPFLS